MQTRPYPEKDGLRIWLSRTEWAALLEAVDDEPRRRIAIQLGLHGLRTHELLQVEPRHAHALANGADGHVLTVEDGKTGKRELPISANLVERISYLKSAARMRQDDPIVDVSKRSVRNMIKRTSLKLTGERQRQFDRASEIVAARPDDDPPMSVVIDAAFTRFLSQKRTSRTFVAKFTQKRFRQ